MKEEMKSLKDNKTWVLVPKPKNTSIVDSKWIFKLKNENDSLRYKARLVAKGFTQKEDENIYMAQPCGFIDNRNPEHVCLLKKSLYGLKQSPRQWNKKFDNFMKTLMFHKSAYDPCLYFKFVNNAPIFLVLYVDDMLIASPDLSMIEKLQNDLRKTFEMKDLGNAKKILGMTIDRDRKTSSIFLNQKAYVISVLEKFSMINAKSSSVPLAPHFQLSKDQSPKSDSEKKLMEKVPYSNAIGSVMYLMVCTRPDIAYAVSCLSRYMSNAGPPHWEALKWLLRYLSGSANTEYIATTEAFKEAMWLEGLLKEIGFLNNKELVSLSLQVPHRRPAMMIARDPYPGQAPHRSWSKVENEKYMAHDLIVRSLGVTLGELYAVVEQPVLGFQPYRGCVTRISGSGHSEPFPSEIDPLKGLHPTDQIAPPDFVPAVYFYQPDAKFSNLGKSNNLKKSLSQVLSRFYPLAGRLVDNLYVDCNDQGATYIEAVANCNLSQVITNPVTNNITKFLPYKVDDVQDIGMAVQVTYFQCGGTAVGLVISHKIGDGLSFLQAANTWAAVARNGNYDDVPEPKFEGAKIFPPGCSQVQSQYRY
ncbi:UNVERIFIED_CONTAM: Retrovirus-related Pol polyprotein from transposon TNT 1-94 [Sesamum radiatum]|uniref:Retrovirus-related Pol polyprotein from transposon TNT 1-94 n=1 Tax=Sesamum radiatum TaxID=300843 RepID=A0AAW2TVE4_SESRA